MVVYSGKKRSRSGGYGMSKRRKYTKRTRTRVRRKSRRGRRGRVGAVRRTLPDYTFVAFNYHECVNVPFATTFGGAYRYKLNSLFDPNESGTGHQPLGRDQYAPFFQKYRVFASRMSVRFAECSVQTNEMAACIYGAPQGTTPGGTDLNLLFELPNATVHHINKKFTSQSTTIKRYFKMHKLAGVSKNEYNTDLVYEAYNGSSPESCPRALLYVWDPLAPLTTGNVDIWVNIVFYAQLFRRQPLPQS